MRSRVTVAITLLMMVLASFLAAAPLGPQSAQAARSAQTQRVTMTTIHGYLVSSPTNSTFPLMLSVQTVHGGVVMVTVATTTKIVRRYNGLSSIDELGINDVVVVNGAMIAPSAMAASWIQDTSIQETSSRAIALVTAVAPTAVSAVVQNDPTGRSPLTEGQNLTLPVGAATQVISGNVIMTGTTSMVQPGLRVIILGIYSRVSNSFQSITRLRVLHAFVMPTSHLVTGRIVSAPVNDRSPTTFTVMDTAVGLVIISVGATTPVYRHYGAKTQIDELSTGDLLRVEGSFLTGSLFAATAITDWSIQKPEDRFYGKIISMNGNTVTARKLADPQDNLNVIPVGAVITLKVSATTAILVPAPSPAVGVVAGTVAQLGVNRVIGVYGIYDRAHRTYTVVAKLRMYR